jgi:hypothetical protein
MPGETMVGPIKVAARGDLVFKLHAVADEEDEVLDHVVAGLGPGTGVVVVVVIIGTASGEDCQEDQRSQEGDQIRKSRNG